MHNMAKKSVAFSIKSAARISQTVRRVEKDPYGFYRLRSKHKTRGGTSTSAVSFWGKIVLEGPDSGDVDYEDHRYWVKEQSYVISGTTVTFSDKEDGLHTTAINLAEQTLPSCISDTHNITKSAIELDWDEDSGDSSTAPNVKWYEENVIVPIFKLTAGGNSIYVFNFLRGQFVQENYLNVETTDADGCPDVYSWNRRYIMAWDFDQDDSSMPQ